MRGKLVEPERVEEKARKMMKGRKVKAPEDLDRYVRQLLSRCAGRYLAGRRRRKDARLARLAQLCSGADGGQQQSVAEHARHVIVHVANGACLPLRVLEGKPRERHAAPVGEQESGPSDQEAALPRRHLIVVAADEL